MPPPTSTLKPVSPAAESHQMQADVVEGNRGAILARAADRDLELARQPAELGVDGGPLPHDLAERARVDDLVGRDAGVLVRSDVAQAVAAGLYRMHLDFGEPRQDVGRLFQPDPVELDVLACREMAIAAIVLARDRGKHAQLPRRQQPVGNRDAQHRRVPLQIKAIAQTQRPKLVLGELAAEETPHLVAIFGDAFEDQRAIDRVVAIHRRANVEARGASASNDCCCRYIARRWSCR